MGTKTETPQPDIVQSERPWNGMSPLNSAPRIQKAPQKRRSKDYKSQMGWRTPRAQSLLNTETLMDKGTHETEAADTGLA